MSSNHDRREFIATVAAATGLAAIGAPGASAQGPAAASGTAPQLDLSWLDPLKGKHKQVFDYGSWDLSQDARPFRFVRNYIDSHKEVNRLEPPDVNATVGISRPSFAANASDALWVKYKLGEHFKINDPMTCQPSLRNIFLDAANEGVKALQASGVVFWQCNVALNAMIAELARSSGLPAAEVRADVTAGLNPGVRIVSSHMFALGLVQERGFTYIKA